MKRQQLAAIATALLLVGSMGGIAAADYTAPPSADTSTTDDTASTSEVAPGDTLGENHTFEANSSNNKTLQWISDSNETKVELYRNGSGHITYADSAPTTVVWNSTAGDGHYNSTFTHAQLLDVEHAAGENVTMKMEFTDNTSLDESNQSVGNSTIYVEYDNSTSVQHVDDSDVSSGDLVTTENKSGLFTLDMDRSTIETNERTVNGSQTDVYVTYSNQTVASDFSNAASEASSGDKLSGLSLTRNIVLVKSSSDDSWTWATVYQGQAPSDASSDDTYAVQSTYGGSDGVKVNLGSEFDDSNSVTVKTVGGAGLGTHIKAYASSKVPSLTG